MVVWQGINALSEHPFAFLPFHLFAFTHFLFYDR
jgi:hypothetical protein